MKPEAQRIAIAEACPEIIKFDLGIWKWKHQNGSWCTCLWGDPLADLNAMHEAEKVLTETQFQTYLDWLDVSCGGELELSAMIDGSAFGFGLVHATAAQRAEAFGLTLNLWEAGE